ncbi:ATP-dependent DNA ligase [Marinicrinis sediminis]|uniref:DNA ligase (ATP) n=1 Tax=Marinicrinis sediminis TaxID=1652465 RepID=A0ABW5R750_9BACL
MKPLVPFEPVKARAKEMPTGANWISQLKWDGVRMLTYFQDGQIELYNRRRNERTRHYPELGEVSRYRSANSLILDGEVIAMREGKPSFYEVMKRDGIRHTHQIQGRIQRVPVHYMVFDLLYLNGEWVTSRPLRERQALLQEVVRPDETVQLVESFTDHHALSRFAKDHDLEGIVFKDMSSTYVINGKDDRWRKQKNHQELIAVVGGVTFRGAVVNALLLGLYDEEGRLWHIGNAGGGKVSQREWQELTEAMPSLAQEACPFVHVPAGTKQMRWTRPLLTVKVQYLEWAEGHMLRQPTILGFVAIPPQECRFSSI